MTKQFWQFIIVLLALLLISLFVHYFTLNKPDVSSLTLLFIAYAVNVILAIVIFVVVEKLRKSHTASLGFIFMGGSLVKFLVFFVVFRPAFNFDGEMSKTEFFFFFIPYVLSLVLEVVFLIKLLNTETK